MHEPKHLHPERKPFNSNQTLVIKEYSIKNDNEPYYPINDEANRIKHRKYKLEASKIKKFEFGGKVSRLCVLRYGYDDFCSIKKI